MGKVAALIGAAVAGGLAAAIPTGITIFGTTFVGLQAGLIVGVGSFALSMVQTALTPKPKAPNLASFEVRQQDQTTLIRQPITSWRYIFGEALVSGPLTFYESTDNNKFHHLVITLAHHEVQAIKAVYFDDEPIYDTDLDAGGNVIAGKFAGKARIKKHLGQAGQIADADLLAAVSKLDANFKGTGVAYIYVRTETDRDLFPGVIPTNIKAWVKGLKLLDTRDAGTRWSPNPALAIRYYLTDTTIGKRVAGTDVDDATVSTAANACEEMVATKAVSHTVEAVDAAGDALDLDGDRLKFFTGDRVRVASTGTVPGGLAAATDYFVIHAHELKSKSRKPRIKLAATYSNALAETAIDITSAGSGTITVTKNAEPRYTLNYVLDTARRPADILEEMRWAMAGFVPINGPKWSVIAGAYTAPTITLAAGNFRGAIRRQGRHSRRERYNAVKGIYVSHLNAGQPTDYPPVTSVAYETADGGGRVFHELDLPGTNRPQTAQRIAKIALERHRREQTFSFRAALTGLRLQAGGTVGITESRRGWTNQPFFIESWGLAVEDGGDAPELYTDFVCRETAAAVYAFDAATEEQTVQPAPVQSPLDPTKVGNPTNLTLTSGTDALDRRLDGTVFSRIKVSWTAPADAYVTAGGRIEVQYKKSASATWLPHAQLDGALTETFILDVKDGDSYDVQVRSINQIGVRAATWVQSLNHTVLGKSQRPVDVTGFSAVQNGTRVNFRTDPNTEADNDRIEIRRATAGVTDWTAGVATTNVLRGHAMVSEVVPPGAWTFLAKAFDTSGNESLNAARFDLTVTNPNTVVAAKPQAPDWLGTLTGCEKHWTGVLVPSSTKTAAQHTREEMFEQFVPFPVAECLYESPEIDIGFDAGFRLHATMNAALGRGVTAGAAVPSLEIDHRLAAGAYDGFEPWTVGEITARFVKARLKWKPAVGKAYVSAFTPTGDKAVTRERIAESLSVAAGGTAVTFSPRYFTAPTVEVQPVGATARLGQPDAVTATGCTARLFDPTTGAGAAGTADVYATGART